MMLRCLSLLLWAWEIDVLGEEPVISEPMYYRNGEGGTWRMFHRFLNCIVSTTEYS